MAGSVRASALSVEISVVTAAHRSYPSHRRAAPRAARGTASSAGPAAPADALARVAPRDLARAERTWRATVDLAVRARVDPAPLLRVVADHDGHEKEHAEADHDPAASREGEDGGDSHQCSAADLCHVTGSYARTPEGRVRSATYVSAHTSMRRVRRAP